MDERKDEQTLQRTKRRSRAPRIAPSLAMGDAPQQSATDGATDGEHRPELERLMQKLNAKKGLAPPHQPAPQKSDSTPVKEEITPPATDDEANYPSKELPSVSPPKAKRALSQPVIGSSVDEEVLLKIFCLVRAATTTRTLARHGRGAPH